VRPTDHSASRPTTPADADPLADNSPFTLAVAFLRYQEFAVADTYADDFGKERFRNPRPTALRHFREEYYRYNGCIYERVEIELLRADLNDFLTQQRYFGKDGGAVQLRVTESLKRDVFGQIRDLCQARVTLMPAWLNGRTEPAPRDIIAFQDGLLDVQEWLRDQSIRPMDSTPHWFSTNVLSCRYDHDARCTLWLRFLGDVLEGKQDLIDLLQEWFGYCLTSDTSFQKLLWMHGVSGAGKSTVATILQRVIGGQNVVRFDLWDLAAPFGLSPFLNKTLAISADAHLGHTSQAEQVMAKLKQISGDDETSVNRKNKEILESIKLTTRFVILTNEFPTFSDASEALTRRAMFIPFNRSFVGQEDPTLLGRLTAEIPGITMWALEGLGRLLQRGRFADATSADEITNDFRRLQSPVLAFVEDCCELLGGEHMAGVKPDDVWVSKDDVYARYVKWCKENERTPIHKDRFASKLKRVAPGIEMSRPWDGGRRVHRFSGIRLRADEVVLP
jgi:putative DNA primase/helicase